MPQHIRNTSPLGALLILLLALLSSCMPTLHTPSSKQQFNTLKKIPQAEWSYARPIRSKIHQAYQLTPHHPATATALFLTAAHDLEPYKYKSDWAYRSYQHALGMGIELAHRHNLWGQTLRTKNTSISLPAHTHLRAFHPQIGIDSLSFAGQYKTDSLPYNITSRGEGVPIIATSKWTKTRQKLDPFFPKVGKIYALTATAQWHDSAPHSTSVTFTLTDPRINNLLASNYSAPLSLVEAKTKSFTYQGLINVLRPSPGLDSTALFAMEPIDPSRTPVIFVHGLAASPNLWIKPTNRIFHNKKILDHYQAYVFFYPTGLPLAHNAAALKKEIRALQKHLKKLGAQRTANQMVIIGHSMGGLLTSAVTRDYSHAAQEIYNKDLSQITADQFGKSAITELLEKPPLHCITRAIFISTPHRGSKYANNFIGQFGSYLIRVPKSILTINPSHYRQDLTKLGQKIFDPTLGLDGIQRLKYDNPALEFNLTRPKLPSITYHSIIGDRGWPGPLATSTDGVVRYSSSHLDSAVSECIVPSWHNAQDSPRTTAEIIRILLVHLESQKN